jgi:2-haloacid dehalogenase
MYSGNGDAFVSLFQTRLFEYQWLRALGGRYKDFLSIVDDAHIFAATQLGEEATDEKRTRLRDAFLKLKAWPDAADALQALKARGIKLAFLSNMTTDMLNSGLINSGLEGVLDLVLSTDTIRTFKPDPRAYQLGVDEFKLPKEQIIFAAFAGWDAVGAEWFGYPTLWINRLGAEPEILDAKKTVTVQGLHDLVRFLDERK